MRYLAYPFVFVLFFACGDTAPEETKAPDEVPVAETSAEPADVEVAQPCEAISREEVAAVFGWPGTLDPMPTTMMDGRLQSCFYKASDDTGASTITVSASSERTQESKGLERAFQADLDKTDGRTSWSEMADGPGDQALFGQGKQGPSNYYILHWREGNAMEYKVDLSVYDAQDPEAVKAKLLQLAELL